ncbi:hypothetical protein GCM10010915_12070 [Microbacterium faecale]|uniref:DUF1376 domain-containing protein n=1 Tax=Microbacterium faecale TaxID=1804630 RepID=A0A917DFP3_9MICO|nr:hypothetical protein [Microbacterium faecale]GGD33270.1 hypothetical protein GCM10010915_12070 [Microbacterium faecale]
MPWFKVDDGFYTSRKVLSIPRSCRLAAVGLWTMAGNWSGRELTDGRVPNYVLAELGATSRLRRALVEARLWLDHGSDGIEFNKWAEYQPTRSEVEADRAKAAERQRKWRERHKGETSNDTVSNGVTAPVTNGVSNDAPTRPDPTRTSNEVLEGARKRAHRIPDPFIVTGEMREWAAREVPGLDIDDSTSRFADYWRAESGAKARKLDWIATWRNWLRRDDDNASRRLTPSQRAQKTAAAGRRIAGTNITMLEIEG